MQKGSQARAACSCFCELLQPQLTGGPTIAAQLGLPSKVPSFQWIQVRILIC